MNLFQFFSQYFWAVCLTFSAYNYLTSEHRLISLPPGDLRHTQVAQRHRRWFALAAAMPWCVMGYGQLIGGVPTVWHYFRPQDRNPYVIAWIGSIFMLSVVYAAWVLFDDGARKANQYGVFSALGRRGVKPKPEWQIKFLAAAGPFFAAA